MKLSWCQVLPQCTPTGFSGFQQDSFLIEKIPSFVFISIVHRLSSLKNTEASDPNTPVVSMAMGTNCLDPLPAATASLCSHNQERLKNQGQIQRLKPKGGVHVNLSVMQGVWLHGQQPLFMLPW